jgi:hypothetical protein
VSAWPQTREELIEEQPRLGALHPPPWQFAPGARVGGVFVCFVRGGSGPGASPTRPGRPPRSGRGGSSRRDERVHRTSRGCSRCARARCSRPRCARSPARPTYCSSTQPAAITRAGPALHSTSARSWIYRRSVSHTARSRLKASGLRTSAAPAARSAWGVSSSVTGCERARGRARSPFTRHGVPTRTRRLEWCWRRPAHGRRNRCVGRAAEPARPARPLRGRIRDSVTRDLRLGQSSTKSGLFAEPVTDSIRDPLLTHGGALYSRRLVRIRAYPLSTRTRPSCRATSSVSIGSAQAVECAMNCGPR